MMGIRFQDYIRNLAAYLSHSYDAAPSGISIKLDVDDIILNIEAAVPCGMIVNELVSNSLKHAFTGGRKGEVFIELHSEGDGRFRLAVGDDGTGLDLEKQKMQTLGLRLVNALVSQLDGRMRMDASRGTRFEIDFLEPKYKERLSAKRE
jgi:two-component sensor histidine kinase